MIYEIKRGATVVWSGKASGKQYKRIMQEDRVEISLNTTAALVLKKGDTIVVYGQTYKINRPENISKVNTQIGYKYSVEFEAEYYDLGKWTLYSLDRNNQLTEPSVFVMGNAATILDLVVRNANRANIGWSLGIIEDTDVIQWTYSGAKLLTVLQDVADQTNLEFWVDGKVVNLTRRQPDTGVSLEYGKGKGLYELHRIRREKPIVTHLTVLGGSRNIPNNYGFRNIQPSGGNPLVNPGYSAGMDRVESVLGFDNVYPRLIAKVTSVQGINTIRSTDLDFDLSANLLDTGASAQIAFTSGQLAGFVFTINASGYDHTYRQITFNRIENDTAYPGGVPSPVIKPAIGDSFVLLNISMPPSYVYTAEIRVKELADQYFLEEGVEQYDWTGKITPKFVIENNLVIVLGGVITLIASDIGFNDKIRIASFERDLQQEYLYDFTLSNVITINSIVREANYTDRISGFFNSTTSGGQGGALQDLYDVTKVGKVTPLDMTTRGTHNTHLLGAPSNPPPVGEMKADLWYLSVNENAGSGETPIGLDFYIKQAKDANLLDIQPGQYIKYDGTKFVPGNLPDLSGLASESWVLAQDYAPKSWVNSQGFLKVESDTLQSVTDRGNITNNFIKIGGVSNIVDGNGLELFFSSGQSAINSYGRGTSNAYLPLNIGAEYVNFSQGGILVNGNVSATGGNSTQWNNAYTHSQSIGNPHSTQFAQLLNKPTTLSGYGISDSYTKVESDARFKPIGYIPSWNEITGKPLIDVNPSANSIAQRDANGYLHAHYISLQQTKSGLNTVPINGLLGFNTVNGDYYAYQFSLQAVNQFLGMPANGDTLQSVTNRGSFTTSFVKFGGVSNVVDGDGLELFFSAGNSVINSYGRGTSNAYLPLDIGASVLTLSAPLVSAVGKVTAPVMQPGDLILPENGPTNPEPGVVHFYFTTI